ncbi:MAG: NADP-dependent oxidoreductase [Deltaproteobacteria bacterium]|nr:NADP-dependent oxidoreductase [Deltaproteobacteria bacterium]
MKALVAKDYGDVDQLELREMPEPPVGPDDVKVRVAAASINPIDWKLLSGARRKLMELHFPAILGRDASGEVLAVGANVKAFQRGDRVLGLVMGAFAEQVTANQNAWALLPSGLDALDAAALPLVTLTGAQLAERVEPAKGRTILVTGALGGVGRATVFVAKSAGATVFAGVRKSQKQAAMSLGADRVIALDDDAELAAVPELDGIADTVNGETIAKLLPRIKKGGHLGSVVGEPAGARERGLQVKAMLTQPDSKRLEELARAVAAKKLIIPVEKRFPLAQAPDAIRLARGGGVGKVLVLP